MCVFQPFDVVQTCASVTLKWEDTCIFRVTLIASVSAATDWPPLFLDARQWGVPAHGDAGQPQLYGGSDAKNVACKEPGVTHTAKLLVMNLVAKMLHVCSYWVCDAFMRLTSKEHLTLTGLNGSKGVNQQIRLKLQPCYRGIYWLKTVTAFQITHFFLSLWYSLNYCTAARTKYTDSCCSIPSWDPPPYSALCHKPLFLVQLLYLFIY